MRPQLMDRLYGDPSLTAFAVIDGAACDGLPGELARLESVHYCLYLGEIAPDLAAVAPWLVMLPHGSEVAQWWAARPAGAGEGITGLSTTPDVIALRRHLRTLTTVVQPGGATVLFRFYDPVVLNQVLPLLDDAQQARLFGPIAELWAEPATGGPPIVHLRRPSPEPPPRGLLRISETQMAELDAQAVRSFEQRLVEFLERRFPEVTTQLPPDHLPNLARTACKRGPEYGLVTERDLARWAFLALFMGEDFMERPEAEGAFTPLSEDPDAGPANQRTLEYIVNRLSGQ